MWKKKGEQAMDPMIDRVIEDGFSFLLFIAVLAFFWFHPWRHHWASHPREKAGRRRPTNESTGIHQKAA
jgi:hypothetical protein